MTSGHVSGGPGGMHITWNTSATTDAPEHVVGHFEQILGRPAERTDVGWIFRIDISDEQTQGRHVLEIFSAQHAARKPGREVPPSPGERTVLLASTGVGGRR